MSRRRREAADQTVAFFERVRAGAGACTGERVTRAPSPTAAEVELTCASGTLVVRLEAEPTPPHRLLGVTITPR